MRFSIPLLLAFLTATAAPAAPMGPIIDVHRHPARVNADDEAERTAVLKEMDDNGVVLALLHLNEPSDLEDWVEKAPGRFIAGPAMPCWRNRAGPPFFCFPETQGWPDIDWLEREIVAGRVGLLGEMLFNYSNVSPDDPRMEPYWALAAKHDVPVMVHTGRGPGPGQGPRDENCCPDYDEQWGNPSLLRRVLQRHPNLRVAILHFGAGDPPDHPYHTLEGFALLRDFPNVHLDMTIINSLAPAAMHEAALKALIDAGFGDRIMFGTDNLPIPSIVDRMEAIEWLTSEQRSAIYYDNAARFLRLSPEQIAEHRRIAAAKR